MFLTKKTVTGVTAKLTKVAQDLRQIEEDAAQEAREARVRAAAAEAEQQTANKIAGNIETLLGL